VRSQTVCFSSLKPAAGQACWFQYVVFDECAKPCITGWMFGVYDGERFTSQPAGSAVLVWAADKV
jgi:hypothetical protein